MKFDFNSTMKKRHKREREKRRKNSNDVKRERDPSHDPKGKPPMCSLFACTCFSKNDDDDAMFRILVPAVDVDFVM